MGPEDVERVRQIVRDELGPALEQARQWADIEARMTAHITAFQQQIRTDVEHHHGENRARLQLLYDQAVEAAQKATLAAVDAAKAVAGNDYIVDRLGQQDARGERTQALVLDLLGEVRGWAGRHQGMAETEAAQEIVTGKRIGVARWIGGTLVTGGAGRWVWIHWLSKWWESR